MDTKRSMAGDAPGEPTSSPDGQGTRGVAVRGLDARVHARAQLVVVDGFDEGAEDGSESPQAAELAASLSDLAWSTLVVPPRHGAVIGAVRATNADAVLLLAGHDPEQVLPLARRVLEEQCWRLMPIMVLSDAAADEAERQRVLALGVTDLLPPSVNPVELDLRLRNAARPKAMQDLLQQIDPVTGLANRSEFMRRVDTALSRRWASSFEGAAPERRLVLLNIDHFKQLNDHFGARIGDEILRALARRMSAIISQHGGQEQRADWLPVRAEIELLPTRAPSSITPSPITPSPITPSPITPPSVTPQPITPPAISPPELSGADTWQADLSWTPSPWVARIDSDQFMALLPGSPGEREHDRCLRQLEHMLAVPFTIAAEPVYVSASIGVATFPDDGDSAEVLTRNAEIALQDARRRGRSHLAHFDQRSGGHDASRWSLQNDLRPAIEGEQLELWFQPQVDSESLEMVSVEALLRWNHPTRGPIPPSLFVPMAEHIGMIEKLGAWVFEAAVRQAARWDEQGFAPMPISVNLSALQFVRGDIARTIQRTLRMHGIPGSRFTIELTESVLMDFDGTIIHALQQIKKLGVAVSLDDFGTGYSSLLYLRRFPVDEIKLDRMFVRGLPRSRDNAAIVSAIITLARELSIGVVAEGVETRAEMSALRSRGSLKLQGSLFGSALPADELEKAFKRR